jgi:hypothetical protein
MEHYRRLLSFLSKISCKPMSGFQKYNDSNDVSLNKSVHIDIEEHNIIFNDNDEKLPSVVENNNIDNLVTNDIKMDINSHHDDSEDEFKEFEQFKKIDYDENDDKNEDNECGDFFDGVVLHDNVYAHNDIEYDITLINSNNNAINNIDEQKCHIDDFDKNF